MAHAVHDYAKLKYELRVNR